MFICHGHTKSICLQVLSQTLYFSWLFWQPMAWVQLLYCFFSWNGSKFIQVKSWRSTSYISMARFWVLFQLKNRWVPQVPSGLVFLGTFTELPSGPGEGPGQCLLWCLNGYTISSHISRSSEVGRMAWISFTCKQKPTHDMMNDGILAFDGICKNEHNKSVKTKRFWGLLPIFCGL